MDQIATTILSSGRSAVELALFILLPIMIVMLSIMRWLEARGLLHRIVNAVSPLLRPFGLTGLGVFALIQVSMVSFAAPIATLAIMARNGSSPRHIAATLAMVLALAQAAGIRLGEQDLERWYTVLNTLSPQGKTSMLQDIEAGRRTEVDSFAGKSGRTGQTLRPSPPPA
ncbi:MAG: hypothetical protein LRY66_12810, partial [Saccharospirillaceae bacterium]|nr:hypothetical protein [Saccharospirillaceae bacterium]